MEKGSRQSWWPLLVDRQSPLVPAAGRERKWADRDRERHVDRGTRLYARRPADLEGALDRDGSSPPSSVSSYTAPPSLSTRSSLKVCSTLVRSQGPGCRRRSPTESAPGPSPTSRRRGCRAFPRPLPRRRPRAASPSSGHPRTPNRQRSRAFGHAERPDRVGEPAQSAPSRVYARLRQSSPPPARRSAGPRRS